MGLQVARNPRAGPGAHAWSGLLEVLGDAFSSPWVLVKSLLKIPAHLSSAGGRTLVRFLPKSHSEGKGNRVLP